jgi:hypothetical protein
MPGEPQSSIAISQVRNFSRRDQDVVLDASWSIMLPGVSVSQPSRFQPW